MARNARGERAVASWGVGLVLCAMIGCQGSIEDAKGVAGDGSGGAGGGSGAGPGGTGGTGGGPGVIGDGEALCTEPQPDVTPMRLLSLVEYNRTVADLLGETSAPLTTSPRTNLVGFDNDALGLSVSPLLVEHYMEVAESVAARAVTRMASIVPCDPAAGRACAEEFVRTFATRAFRRPISADEQTALIAVFDAGAATSGFAGGIELTLAAILQSPDFLYHVEVGDPSGATSDRVPLTGYEVASRLSYFLWNTMPDQALFDAAASGALSTPEGVRAQAERMLEDPRARDAVRHFHAQWLGIEDLEQVTKDSTVFPAFTPEFAASLKEETLAFLEELTFGGGAVPEIFSASWTMLNSDLAAFYGVPGSATSASMSRVELDPSVRAGVLTHASVMATYAKGRRTSPVHRGLFVRTRILCQEMPAPPPDIPPLPDEEPGVNERERLARHRSDAACAGCHELMDPIGFSFEHYDADGSFRTTDVDGAPVDATGEIVGTWDSNGPVDDAVHLSQRLADSDQVRACVTKQWFRYALGRRETADDECVLEQLFTDASANEWRIRDLVVAITQTDAFRFRRIVATEGACE